MSFAIAIDGPAAAGKGTIARAIAARFGLPHLDTGLLYRAVGLKTLDGTGPEAAARALQAADLEDEGRLRSGEAAEAASRVAALPAVRAALVDFQRAFAMRAGGAVLDGRDIGTVICPDAAVKLFVTASDPVRARRRHSELIRKGHVVTLEEVAADLARRDARDRGRTDAPLAAAADAHHIDTTSMSIAEAVEEAARVVGSAKTASVG